MKSLLICTILIANINFCFSQEIIDLNFDLKKKELSPKSKKIKFKSGKTYQVKIHNVNTSYMGSKLETESYILYSSTPDILTPIFLGITGNSQFYNNSKKQADNLNPKILVDSCMTLNKIYKRAMENYNNLRALKRNSDSLYSWSQDKTTKIQADSIKSIVFKIFGDDSIDSFLDLKRKVNLSINYIVVSNELFKGKIENMRTEELINNNIIEHYAELRYVTKVIQSDNYYKYVKFIENAINPDTIIYSKPFIAEKDIVDLNITIVNNYKIDTLYNSSISFYTSKNCSFDFSTGFFYNNLQENSYYLEKRDTLVNNVLKNDNIPFDLSFGALGHISYKITNYTKIGFSLGAALSPFDGKIRYLIGGSIVFGRNKQVGLNGGLALVKMNTLSNLVQNDEIGAYVPISVVEVPTYGKIQKGFYIGITYNLTSKKKN